MENIVRFKQSDFLIFNLNSDIMLSGKLQKQPSVEHDYWYISTDDESLIAICSTSIINIIRPSEKMLDNMLELEKEFNKERE